MFDDTLYTHFVYVTKIIFKATLMRACLLISKTLGKEGRRKAESDIEKCLKILMLSNFGQYNHLSKGIGFLRNNHA